MYVVRTVQMKFNGEISCMIFILAAERNPARSFTGFEPVASTFTDAALSASNLAA